MADDYYYNEQSEMLSPSAEALSLHEMLSLVKGVIEADMPRAYWVKAEISELHLKGHCFIELVEKDSKDDRIIAKTSAHVWRSRWGLINGNFMSVTHKPLTAGLSVLIKVEATFHEQYGFSLNILDIDPSFTIGDIARRRQEILNTLKEEGIDNMNKELPLPMLLQRIAVISSATAAGYGDFCNQLLSNNYGLVFYTRLFPAIMQGENVERSVIAALDAIAAEAGNWDAVVIIRGGGAVSDLSGFDTLLLAENVAQFPLPVITGIGHERDDTVIDMISHTRVKTPTAAAEFLIHHQEQQLAHIEDMAETISTNVSAKMNEEKMRLSGIVNRLPLAYRLFRTRENNKIDRNAVAIRTAMQQSVQAGRYKTDLLLNRLRNGISSRMMSESHLLEMLGQKLHSFDPKRQLALGYSITRINGKAVRSGAQLKAGDVITTEFESGKATSVVSSTESK